MQKTQKRVKEIIDLMVNRSFEEEGFSTFNIDMTPIQNNSREYVITLSIMELVVRVEFYQTDELIGTITIEMDHISYARDLEELEKVLNNLDRFENPSREEVEEMRKKWKVESDKRFEETLLEDVEGSN